MTVSMRLALPLVLLLAAACGGSSPSGQPSPSGTPPTATATATPSAPVTHEVPVHVYFLRDEKVASVHRQVAVDSGAVATATVRALLSGPTGHERALGLSTTIPTGSRLLGLSISKGTADVNLNLAYESGGGSLSMTGRLMQMVFTLTQFSTVQRVTFRIAGEPVSTFGGEGVMLDHPVTRTDFESFLPAIFIDSPAIGETVSSPLTVHGLANVFEGQFLVEVTTAGGKLLVRRPAHAAMGHFADFTTELRFTVATPGPGRVTGFDRSAKDGSRVDDYVVPVRLR